MTRRYDLDHFGAITKVLLGDGWTEQAADIGRRFEREGGEYCLVLNVTESILPVKICGAMDWLLEV